MTTIYITSDDGSDLDPGFAEYLAAEVEADMGPSTVNLVSHDSALTREHAQLVEEILASWGAMSQADRDAWVPDAPR